MFVVDFDSHTSGLRKTYAQPFSELLDQRSHGRCEVMFSNQPLRETRFRRFCQINFIGFNFAGSGIFGLLSSCAQARRAAYFLNGREDSYSALSDTLRSKLVLQQGEPPETNIPVATFAGRWKTYSYTIWRRVATGKLSPAVTVDSLRTCLRLLCNWQSKPDEWLCLTRKSARTRG